MIEGENNNEKAGVSDTRACTGSDEPFKIRLFVKGEDSGAYSFRTKEEADDHYDWSKKNFGVLGCRYKKEYPNDLNEPRGK